MAAIPPTVGRDVWYYRFVQDHGHQGPLAAHIANVYSDKMVNLMVINSDGTPQGVSSVSFIQDATDKTLDLSRTSYCTWPTIPK